MTDRDEEPATSAASAASAAVRRHPARFPGWALVGGLLPLLGIVAGFRATDLGQVIAPTWFDLGAVAASCVAVLVVDLRTLRHAERTFGRQLVLGFALGVAGTISLLCLPALPVFLIAVVMGVGVLALASYWNLLALLFLALRLRTPERASAGERWRLGMALSVAMTIYPATVIWRVAERQADAAGLVASGLRASDSGEMPPLADRLGQAEEDLLLRSVRQRTLLASCFYRRPFGTDVPGVLGRVMNDAAPSALDAHSGRAARVAWFRATARPVWLESVPSPFPQTEVFTAPASTFSMGMAQPAWRVPLDDPAGTGAVRGPLQSLELDRTEVRVAVPTRTGGSGFTRLSWTFDVANHARVPRQTRMQFRLPPGGFVEDLHLWVGGRQQRAAFAANEIAIDAYEAVARPSEERWAYGRDPALLRQVSHDRYRLVVYPVPEDGLARFRVSFVVPTRRTADGTLQAWLPTLMDRDAELAGSLALRVLVGAPLDPEHPDDAPGLGPAVSGLDPEALRDPLRMRVTIPVQTAAGELAEPREDATPELRHQPWPRPGARPLVVLDAFHGHDAHFDAAFVAAVSEGLEPAPTFVVIRDGQPREVAVEELPRALASCAFRAPYDPLSECAQILARSTDAPLDVLWVHAATDLEHSLDTPEIVAARAALDASQARILTLPATPSLTPNVLVEHWATAGLAVPVFRVSDRLADDVHALRAGSAWLHDDAPRDTSTASPELAAKLSARDAVDRALREGDLGTSIQLATRHRLVTPTVSAVVLESRQDYVDHGIDPPAQGASPPGAAVPEPSTWILVLSGLGLILWQRRRAR